MKFIFSILSLVGVIGFIAWWSTQGILNQTSPTTTSDETHTEITTENPITAPIEKAQEAKTLIESKYSLSLDLSGQGLSKVPDYVFTRTNLEHLDISNNKLNGALQSQVQQLQNLKVLDMSNNDLTGVPAEVGQLKKLEILNLSNNMLTGLPFELGNLSNLQILDISGNNYSEADLNGIKENLPNTTQIKTK